MDIKIKDHIINNFKESDIVEIRESIEASVVSEDEIVLPGLGVFLGIIWESCNKKEKDNLLNKIHNYLKKEEN